MLRVIESLAKNATSGGLDRTFAKPHIVSLLNDLLKIKQGILAIDVGCGTGYFSRFLAKCIGRQGKVIGIDKSRQLIHHAEAIPRDIISASIEYKKGFADNLPIDDNYADLATCRYLLVLLREPLKALLEMKRVIKPGGLVAVIEYDRMLDLAYNSPLFPDFEILQSKVQEAITKACKKLYGSDQRIGPKLPELFLKAGLTDIKAECFFDTDLDCDSRMSIEQRRKYLADRLIAIELLTKQARSLAIAGGMSKREFEIYHKQRVLRLRNLIEHPFSIKTSPFITISSNFVTTGIKPK